MPSGAIGAVGLGLVWGLLCATIDLRRRPVLDIGWLALSVAAVAAASAWITWSPRAAAWAAGAAGAGWLLRRTLESVVEGRR